MKSIMKYCIDCKHFDKLGTGDCFNEKLGIDIV